MVRKDLFSLEEISSETKKRQLEEIPLLVSLQYELSPWLLSLLVGFMSLLQPVFRLLLVNIFILLTFRVRVSLCNFLLYFPKDLVSNITRRIGVQHKFCYTWYFKVLNKDLKLLCVIKICKEGLDYTIKKKKKIDDFFCFQTRSFK